MAADPRAGCGHASVDPLSVDPDRLRFRPADPGDWDAIWPIFEEIVAAGDTYPYPPGIERTEAERLWMSDDVVGRRTYVAEVDDDVMATAYIKPNLVGLGDHVANAGWMVTPRAAGRGVGRRFAHYILDEARRAGFTAMQFNSVVVTNERAIALWQSLGFQIVGTVPDAFRHVDAGPTAVHVMYRSLVDGSGD